MAMKRQSYTTSEKLKIIQFAEEHGNRAAQREFGIAESNVRLWHKSKENLQKMPRLQRADRGRKAAWPRLKQDLMAWITEKRNNGLAILPAMVRLKAFEISKDRKRSVAWHSKRNGCEFVSKVRNYKFLGRFRRPFYIWYLLRWWINRGRWLTRDRTF